MAIIETSSGSEWSEGSRLNLQRAVDDVYRFNRGGTIWINGAFILDGPVNLRSFVHIDGRNHLLSADSTKSIFILKNCQYAGLSNLRLYRRSASGPASVVLLSDDSSQPTQHNRLQELQIQHNETYTSELPPVPGTATAIALLSSAGSEVSFNSIKRVFTSNVSNAVELISQTNNPGWIRCNLFSNILADGFKYFIRFDSLPGLINDNHWLHTRGIWRAGMTLGIGPINGKNNFFDHVHIRRDGTQQDSTPDMEITSEASATYLCAYSLGKVVDNSTSTVFSPVLRSGLESCSTAGGTTFAPVLV